MTEQGMSATLAQMCLALLHGAGQLGIAQSIEAAYTAAEPSQISGIRDTAIDECQCLIDEVIVRGQELDSPEARRLCYLGEARLALEDWKMLDEGLIGGNYLPAFGVERWLPALVDMTTGVVDGDCLSELAHLTQETTVVAALHPDLPRASLVALLDGPAGSVACNNPSLPADVVARQLSATPIPELCLLFHPHAHVEQSWGVIAAFLEDEEWETLYDVALAPWECVREDGYRNFAHFQLDGPHADELFQRIREWCEARPDLDDDAYEALTAYRDIG